MKKYWAREPLHPIDLSAGEYLKRTNQNKNIMAILELQPAEIYLATRYLKNQGCSYDFKSTDDYRAALACWFGLLDSQYIELCFNKYSFITPGYDPINERKWEFVRVSDWLEMVTENR